MTESAAEILRLEHLADAAYEAMYDARPPIAKMHYEDALFYLASAISEAERRGDAVAAERLTVRRNHIRNVYDSQFRGVG